MCTVDILSCGDAVLPPGDGAAFADGEGVFFLFFCRFDFVVLTLLLFSSLLIFGFSGFPCINFQANGQGASSRGREICGPSCWCMYYPAVHG